MANIVETILEMAAHYHGFCLSHCYHNFLCSGVCVLCHYSRFYISVRLSSGWHYFTT